MNIRLLKANEIECRVQSVKQTSKSVGCIMLLYKDARVDMKILDETFGTLGWKRTHELINNNLFCNIDIWDADKKEWVRKQDVGVESNTEKEKGQASDSFKRAGFNIGIGRELYTAPFIWIDLKEGEWYEKNGKVAASSFVKFQVKSITYNEDREITGLEIADSKGNTRYKLGDVPKTHEEGSQSTEPTSNNNTPSLTEKQVTRAVAIGKAHGINLAAIKKQIAKDYKVTDIAQLNKAQYDELCARLEKAKPEKSKEKNSRSVSCYGSDNCDSAFESMLDDAY